MKKNSLFILGIFIMSVLAPSVYGSTDTVIYSGYLYDNEFVFVGPYALMLTDFVDNKASFIVLDGQTPVGPVGVYISEGQSLKARDITINLIEVSEVGVNVIIRGPFGYKLGRSQYEFVINEIKTNPVNVEPGEAFSLELVLSNKGTMAAYSVKATLSAAQGDPSLAGGLPLFMPEDETDSKFIGDIKAREEKLVSFNLRANENIGVGNYPVTLILQFYDGTSPMPRPYMIQFGLRVSGRTELMIINFSSVPDNVRPGYQNVRIIANIANQGTETARFVRAYLELDEPFSLSGSHDSSYNLGTLSGGHSGQAEFIINVDRNAESMIYMIPLIVEYRDTSNKLLKEKFELNFDVKGKPELEIIEYRFVPETVRAGGSARIHMIVQNTGEEKAESIIVEAIERSEQPFDFTNRTDFIGVLNPGQKAEVVLATDIKSSAEEKTYQLNLRIRAVGDKEKQDLNVYLFQRNIDIPVEKSVGNLRIAILIGAVLILLAGGYLIYNKYIRKK